MKTLRKGDKGQQVKDWQHFLIGTGRGAVIANGEFDSATFDSTLEFQHLHDLYYDGIVGPATMKEAIAQGYYLFDDGAVSPLKPMSKWTKRYTFGKIEWKHTPTPTNREHITITNGWNKTNLTRTSYPMFFGEATVHRKVVKQFEGLWRAWDEAGLMHLVKTWHGSYVSRLVRGSTKTLSNHCYGTAFDINYKWNRLGCEPAKLGTEGSVRELVPIANAHGFFWGGHYNKRKDGMHFEIAKVLK